MLVAILGAVPSTPVQLLRQVYAQFFDGGPTSGKGGSPRPEKADRCLADWASPRERPVLLIWMNLKLRSKEVFVKIEPANSSGKAKGILVCQILPGCLSPCGPECLTRSADFSS